MKSLVRAAVALSLLSSLTAHAARSEKERLTRLDADLAETARSERASRHWASGLSLGVGAVAVGIGAALLNNSDGSILGNTWRPIGGFYLGAGIGAMAAGTIGFFYRPESETLPAEFGTLPESSAAEQSKKIARGEEIFEELRDSARSKRYLNGGLLTIFGAAYAIWGATKDESTSGKSTLITTGAILASVGLWNFFWTSDIEDRAHLYQDWKNGLEPVAHNAVTGTSFGLLPQLSGGASLAWNFRY